MLLSFKPYYKWITFNTLMEYQIGILPLGFKPYYKWITFNTLKISKLYYKWITFNTFRRRDYFLH